jgi:hypothetical protein
LNICRILACISAQVPVFKATGGGFRLRIHLINITSEFQLRRRCLQSETPITRGNTGPQKPRRFPTPLPASGEGAGV